MAAPLQQVRFPLAIEAYSEVIDVRSPGEFAEDCVPGAINLPVLDDAERAEVGTIYKQISPFAARKLGAALVSKNISCHLKTHFANKDKSYRPLVYCWRGGQRSNSLAIILSQIGWGVDTIAGGYKAYRSHVRTELERLPQGLKFRILCGLTGTGKTKILQRIQAHGAQVLDLEALANHRGSLLGQTWAGAPQPQPSQKWFESLLRQELAKFVPEQMVWLESESSKIGTVQIPTVLWQQMQVAPCVEVRAPIPVRVEFLLQQYDHMVVNPVFLLAKIERLRSRYGSRQLATWREHINRGDWKTFVSELLTVHYDPTYQRSMAQSYLQRLTGHHNLLDLSP
ncbi:MAG: tRNA 2-selenouridine(34) synthase MnmH, partial [Cyanobacteria bacterium J06641_5]